MGNRIFVELPRTSYFTGDVAGGPVVLATSKQGDARGLSLYSRGRGSTQIPRQQGKPSVPYRSHAALFAWRAPLHGPGLVPPGVQRFPFQFQIPENALPSYTGPHASVGYSLNARLDVPWWPDAVQSVPVFVFFARQSVRTFSDPVRFRSGGGGPEIYVELDGSKFFAREMIGGRITILRLGDHPARRGDVRLIGGEGGPARDQTETTKTALVG